MNVWQEAQCVMLREIISVVFLRMYLLTFSSNLCIETTKTDNKAFATSTSSTTVGDNKWVYNKTC